jgi:threonylcarbamoyladenosine tRNA methylthiotransferase MtaB
MSKSLLDNTLSKVANRTVLSVNFGCRVNAAELNQLTQKLVSLGFSPVKENPGVILINTCAITKKGEYESLSQIKKLSSAYPNANIIVTGCANLDKLSGVKNLVSISNRQKDEIVQETPSYSPQVKDKFSHTNRYILKVQSGCDQFCTYCIVPFRRPSNWFLPIESAIKIVNQAVAEGYEEVIITGVNLNLYTPTLSNLIRNLLEKTEIKLISFGSVPLLTIDNLFIELYQNPQTSSRLSAFLHVPLQSGSNKVLKLMNRPYDKVRIEETFKMLKTVASFSFGTDIIVGFPGETDDDFQQTYDLCRDIGFSKIHTFRFSPRPDTSARILYLNSTKLNKNVIKKRSDLIRSLVKNGK